MVPVGYEPVKGIVTAGKVPAVASAMHASVTITVSESGTRLLAFCVLVTSDTAQVPTAHAEAGRQSAISKAKILFVIVAP
jgi:hypothetical protein